MSVETCRLIELPRKDDRRGSLTFVEGQNHVPFDIQRVYYLYGIPEGVDRGGHAHKALKQLMVAISGSFDVRLDDGRRTADFHLDRPDVGLYISEMNWRELSNFSDHAVCMVLASLPYDESDYFRNYREFQSAVSKQPGVHA